MGRTARILTIATASVAVLLVGSAFLVAGSVVSSGLVTVSVEESGPDGVDLYLPVPAGLVEGVLVLAPMVLEAVGDRHLEAELERARLELDEILPAVEAALEELEAMPTATLVEYREGEEHVLVRKVRGGVEIRVEQEDSRVLVSVPTRVLRAVGGFLAG